MLSRITRQLYELSPRENFARLRTRFGEAGGAEKPANAVLDELLRSPRVAQLLGLALARRSGDPLVLAGDVERFAPAANFLRSLGRTVEVRPWNWNVAIDLLTVSAPTRVALCLLPTTADEWAKVALLKRALGERMTLLTELLLPFTQITFLRTKLGYGIEDLERLLWRYLGEKTSGPVQDLNACWPLAGRSVIEIGPLDGCQTAELVLFGAAQVTCIEARAENVAKTRAMADAFAWPQVRILMDDFHNADATRYGRYDLAFAHGVYYHAVAPFVFLENLRSLANTIFLGGFCSTDESPPSPWTELTYEGRGYRVKEYEENIVCTAGVNRFAYMFHGEDLMRFFTERGDTVSIVSDEKPQVDTAGRYLRFLVTTAPNTAAVS